MNWWQRGKNREVSIVRIGKQSYATLHGEKFEFLNRDNVDYPIDENSWQNGTKRIVVLLPAGTTFWHDEILPYLSAQELYEMAKWEIENWFPELEIPIVGFLTQPQGSIHQHVWAVAIDKKQYPVPPTVTLAIGIPEELAWMQLLCERNAVVFFPLDTSVLVVIYYQGNIWQRWLTQGEDCKEIYASVSEKVKVLADELGTAFTEYHVVAEDEQIRQEWLSIEGMTQWRDEWIHWPEELHGLMNANQEKEFLSELKLVLAAREELAEVSIGAVGWRYIFNILLLIVMLWVGVEGSHYFQVQQTKPMLLQQQRELSTWQARNRKLEELITKQMQDQKERLSWAKILLIIADTCPSHVFLEKISSEGDQVILTGYSLSTKRVQQWQHYLEKRLGMKGNIKINKDKMEERRQFILYLQQEVEENAED